MNNIENDTVISVKNLSKAYKLYKKPIDRLKEAFHPLRKKYHRIFYALNDISFDVKRGETIGIIGKNGSGKSTLLKVLTGVLVPTAGTVKVNGKVSALLELGAGFNPDFTGLENIYFNGSIMGFTKAEMDARIDKILGFADIGDFINQPVKMYSSGMYVRLAFSLAINVEPDILIVDEALSVGDVFFQQKCILKMKQLMNSGITTLFVSHSPETIQSLCTRGVLLDKGSVMMVGDAKTVSLEYIRQRSENKIENLKNITDLPLQTDGLILLKSNELSEKEFLDGGVAFEKKIINRVGDNKKWIKNVKILDKTGTFVNSIGYKEPFTVRIYLEAKEDIANYCIGIRIFDDRGLSISGTTNTFEKIWLPEVSKGTKKIYDFTVKNIFMAGNYSIGIGIEKVVVLNQHHFALDAMNNAEVLTIMPPDDPSDLFLTKVYTPIKISVYDLKKDK